MVMRLFPLFSKFNRCAWVEKTKKSYGKWLLIPSFTKLQSRMWLRKRVTDVWKKLDYRKMKFLTIDFTGFRPKPLVTQVGVLNFQRCKNQVYDPSKEDLCISSSFDHRIMPLTLSRLINPKVKPHQYWCGFDNYQNMQILYI